MKRAEMPVYALAVAILVVGLAAMGVPAGTLFYSLAALACPVMMIFVMAGMHGGHGHGRPDEPADRLDSQDGHPEQPPAAGDRGSAYR